MYQLEWGSRQMIFHNVHHSGQVFDQQSDRMVLCWEEHCMECAPPICYESCPKFSKRADEKCKNFENGITEVIGLDTHYNFGYSIFFRDWSKLETKLSNHFVSSKKDSTIHKINREIIKLINSYYSLIFKKFDRKRKLNGLYYYLRNKFIESLKGESEVRSELFGTIYLPYRENLLLKVETKNFIGQISLKPGYNSFSIKCVTHKNHLLKIFPENNINAEIIICDLAIRKIDFKSQVVKCIVWDLDNTIWNGVLIEDKIDVRTEIIQTIKDLDSRGIINSIVSKNDFVQAKTKLNELGLWEYFVYPKINWNQKSQNLKLLIQELNIGEDAVIFIDDNPFEREEVKSFMPSIRVYDENYFPTNLEHIVKDLPITDDASNRRKRYQIEEKRMVEANKFGLDFISFLHDCELVLTLTKPTRPEHYLRIKELLDRTNQLNLSTNRYLDDEFNTLIENRETCKIQFKVKDKFGDYGTVGFIHFKLEQESLKIIDLVISCRVVQKMVEKSLFSFLINEYCSNNNIFSIKGHYQPTLKNGPMLQTLNDIGFQLIDNELILEVDKFDHSILPVKYLYET